MIGNPDPSSGQPDARERNRQLIARLARRRAELGLSQAEVARRMQTSQSAVARLESGQHNARLSTMTQYAEALGLLRDPAEPSKRLPLDFAESPATLPGDFSREHGETADASRRVHEYLTRLLPAEPFPAPGPESQPGRKPEVSRPWVVIEAPDHADPDRALTGRQREILQFIEECAQRQGFPPTFREIAEGVGLSSASSVAFQMSALERKGYLRRAPGRSRAVEVRPPGSSALRPERESGEDADRDVAPGGRGPAPQGTVPVPLVGRIAAGAPVLAEQHAEDVFLLPEQLVHGNDLFALKVAGDSMTGAGILDGDYVVVRRHSIPENGDIVAAIIEHEATVKTFKRADGHIWLMPHNLAYPPILGDTAKIAGKVVAVLRGGL